MPVADSDVRVADKYRNDSDLPDRRLFTFRTPKNYGALNELIADQVDIASFAGTGMNSCAWPHRFARARSVRHFWSTNWLPTLTTARPLRRFGNWEE